MRRLVVALVAFVVAAAVCLPASAAIVVVQQGELYRMDTESYGHEGPFLMTQQGGSKVFQTFCAEKGEWFYPTQVYEVHGIGGDSLLTNRTLTGYSAWLYTRFLGADNYSKLNTSGWGTTQYDKLQFGIWAGMIRDDGVSTIKSLIGSSTAEQQWGQPTGNPVGTYAATDLDAIGIGPADFANATWAGYGADNTLTADRLNAKYLATGNIVVLNMWGQVPTANPTNPGNAQDQLGYDPDYGAPPVPEPISFVVWALIGLCGCVGVCWRKWKKAV